MCVCVCVCVCMCVREREREREKHLHDGDFHAGVPYQSVHGDTTAMAHLSSHAAALNHV